MPNQQNKPCIPLAKTPPAQTPTMPASRRHRRRQGKPSTTRLRPRHTNTMRRANPQTQHKETHAQQAALNKTETTATQRNRQRTPGSSHGAPNSEHSVYTAPDVNGQQNGRRRTKGRPGRNQPTPRRA